MFYIMKDLQIISVAWCENDGPIYCVGVDDFKGYKPGIMNLDDRKLVEFFVPKIEKADYVVAQNGKGFDFKVWRTRLVVHNLTPHHEPKELDTKQWAKSKFYFASNSQNNMARELGTSQKVETDKKLHEKCIELGDKKYWDQMKRYNKGDVKGLRQIAKRLAPFVTNLPNANVARNTVMSCTNDFCPGGGKMVKRGERVRSRLGKVQTYSCNVCGKHAMGPVIRQKVILR